MRFRRGQEVPGPTRSRGGCPVVPTGRVVQGKLHEPGEGHWTFSSNLGVDACDELVVLAHRLEVWRWFSAQPWGQFHDDRPTADLPSRSLTPAPTNEWPPSRIGMGAVMAASVNERSHGSRIRSACSRSEANRSSVAGQADS